MNKILSVIVAIGTISLWVLGAGIQLLTLYIAYLSGFVPTVITFFFPIGSQLYWIWRIWSVTGIFFNALTELCLLWLVLALGTGILASRLKD